MDSSLTLRIDTGGLSQQIARMADLARINAQLESVACGRAALTAGGYNEGSFWNLQQECYALAAEATTIRDAIAAELAAPVGKPEGE